MAFENSKKLIEITIEGKQYALVPFCVFHDIPSKSDDDQGLCRHQVVKQQFGLVDTFEMYDVYEIDDPKKVMLAKIKYGI